MATILLSAVGAAAGAGFGGTVLGLSGAVIGRAVGATLGRAIDQRLLGLGSDAVETGRIERFRLSAAGEGVPVTRVWGRTRVAGQVIWATRFLESSNTSGGGKGIPKQKVTTYSYSISLALALCEGEITTVGRIWADGTEIARDSLTMRVYPGSETQLPDAKIEAVEGAGLAPAYRGIAYVVIEDLQLEPFGNRVPQLSFEVIRPVRDEAGAAQDLSGVVQAVALIPGTGEYALATTPVHYAEAPGVNRSANVNSPAGKADLAVAIEALGEELPRCGSVSLVVSWFGDDLRCGACRLMPKVEQAELDGTGMAWSVDGVVRTGAGLVPQEAGRPVYGGTPTDASVLEAIAALHAAGQEVMFYPFVLMEQMTGNDLPDPNGATEQPVLPWRGRITLSVAPGRDGSPDGTAAAEAEVAAFFGAAATGDFSVSGQRVAYTGPADWGYRRFILHYAHLCAAAGGVEAFCVGSELVGLTRIRGADGGFPAVAALRALAAEVRAILPTAAISYAADWTEYGAYLTPEGELTFPLDPFWADANVDFVGIDNYLPLSDWRDGDAHADAGRGSIHALDYLRAGVEGGEYYDWYYDSAEAEAAQRRTPITDGYDEPWLWRAKDLRGWWSNAHHLRPGGLRGEATTGWEPGMKPIRFTEIGCAAIDKGANQPNRFLDRLSSESALPRASRGTRDDLMQLQFLRAVLGYWSEAGRNPVSTVYGGPMIDLARAHVWAWDARPFPWFPNATELWADGENWARGHWISGRTGVQPLDAVVAEIAREAGTTADVSALWGILRGYSCDSTDMPRAVLQPLMLTSAAEAVEREGVLRFQSRGRGADDTLTIDGLASETEVPSPELTRTPEAETAGRVRLSYVEAGGDFETAAAEAVFADEESHAASASEIALVLTATEARGVTERWLAEARIARETVRLALPPSRADLGAGDVVALPGGALYRLDRVEQAGSMLVEGVRVEPQIYTPSDAVEARVIPRAFAAPVPVFPLFLDLPLMTGEENPVAPHLAVAATPWPGSVACWASASDDGYALNRLIAAGSVVGVTEGPLFAAAPGLWDRGAPLCVRLSSGALAAAATVDVLNGANLAAIGDGSAANWELIQFARADLMEPGVYEISDRLRGQQGSDALMPADWPAGSLFVLLNGAAQQIDLAAAARGLARHYRIGPAARGYDDPSYVHLVEAFDGIGLKPFAPCHLTLGAAADGTLTLGWIRRTRIDGDSWASVEVPLGEESEAYLVRVLVDGAIRREVTVAAPGWSYAAGERAADGAAAGCRFEVAQISARFGAGGIAGIDWAG